MKLILVNNRPQVLELTHKGLEFEPCFLVVVPMYSSFYVTLILGEVTKAKWLKIMRTFSYLVTWSLVSHLSCVTMMRLFVHFLT